MRAGVLLVEQRWEPEEKGKGQLRYAGEVLRCAHGRRKKRGHLSGEELTQRIRLLILEKGRARGWPVAGVWKLSLRQG